ncbi:MAG TPA: DUF5652 family protein [Candidatus Acidoferrales bacterium]|nr:DUF5652 family protein [Candidatus Acidoferrales bacterium]
MSPDQQQTFLTSLLQSPYIILIVIWEIIWKVIAFWKAARRNQLYWYIAIAIFNTVGILPIIYILFFQKDRNKEKSKSL